MTATTPTTALSLDPTDSFLELAARYLEEYRDKIELALDPFDEPRIWWRPAPGCNSAGNLLLHLAGNLSLWILVGLDDREYHRDRAGEFSAQEGPTKQELLAKLAGVVEACVEVVRGLDPATLSEVRELQTYTVTRLEALFHAVEHMSYHTGQIVQLAKESRSDDFEFYPRHRDE